MFDPSTINCNSVVNKFAVCMNSVRVFIQFWWTDVSSVINIDEIGKTKSINESSVSSISTDSSIQSISSKSDLPIFNDLSIDKSIPIFIDWLLRDYTNSFIALYSVVLEALLETQRNKVSLELKPLVCLINEIPHPTMFFTRTFHQRMNRAITLV